MEFMHSMQGCSSARLPEQLWPPEQLLPGQQLEAVSIRFSSQDSSVWFAIKNWMFFKAKCDQVFMRM
jgi:hypothetical protein